ncbi:hypothetical protein PPTG_00467 [Phytophthora nicotianae INRA-310]|uniref:Uncharacterized protein n=1 Tax=Phytophthora nicotianae (strain INRA-310) TaxID=761204 RepID=W2RHE4_PHYN3|nr:hypothetical protein PPTG_00467 [Phytophthora nicotianae INRA-310]ETN24000.1 hypothetical protein PPTG_00467 [Phytophthora nicotianae INRA-310]
MKMLRVDTEEELSITSAETQPHNKKRKPAGFVIKPLPVYNQSLLDDHRAEKVARARVDTEESQLAINGRQKRTRYATAMLQNGEESAVRGQREQEMWERAALQNLFGIDTEEDELKEIKVSGQEMKMLKMESVAMTVLMMSGCNMVELTKKKIAMFWNEVYVATRIAISSDLCNEVLEETQHLDFKPIFRKVNSEKLDRFRLQASIPVSGAAMGEIHEVIASTVGEANPNWAIKESSWKALKSLPEERCTGEEEEEEEEEEKEEEEEDGGDESGSSGEDTVVFDTERSNEEESEYSGEECNEDEE